MAKQLLLVAASVLAAVTAILAALSWVGPALASLVGAAALAGVYLVREMRTVRDSLATSRRSIAAVYERDRQILTALERNREESADSSLALRDDISAIPASASSVLRQELKSVTTVRREDPSAEEPFAEIVATAIQHAGARARVAVLTSSSGAKQLRVIDTAIELRVARWGTPQVAALPHAYFTHVLLDLDSVGAAEEGDLVWLRRALRWQLDTVIMALHSSKWPATAVLRRLATLLDRPLGVERLSAGFHLLALAPDSADGSES
ncbi:hypothetical protein [Agrococcus carbonis]|uniref:Uncharacterized protein n=1 Tax=Agrococcus carbonis TaxID=684552 RepID=A0A1H1RID0_9MICO|nr:hypothetical protein [Agrococcus carbonis]SDS35442.1 hypothetical protein SAMN04489719_2128 [Agrococcus carbonis]